MSLYITCFYDFFLALIYCKVSTDVLAVSGCWYDKGLHDSINHLTKKKKKKKRCATAGARGNRTCLLVDVNEEGGRGL